MIPIEIDYKRASNVEEVLALLDEHGDQAKILAGGHSLIPSMKLRLNDAKVLIDISKIDSLRGIDDDPDDIVIKSGTTHGEIEHSEIIRNHMPVMSYAASKIGDPQVRNAGTIGGSLAHSDPASDWPGVILALGGQMHLYGNGGIRFIEADDFFTGMFSTALSINEIITSIRIPKLEENTKASYVKFPQPASRYAVVGCAVKLSQEEGRCTAARVAFNGVSTHAYRDTAIENALVGQDLNEGNIAFAAANAAASVYVLSDHFASEEYRKHLATVIAQRAISEAC